MKLKQNKQSKLVVALSAVILLLVALSATLTFAYFTATTGEKSGDAIEFGVLKFNEGSSFSITRDTSDTCTGLFVPGCSVKLSGKAALENSIDA